MKSNFRNVFFVFAFLFTGCGLLAQETDTTQVKNFEGFKTPKFPAAQNVLKSNIIPIFIGQIPVCGEIRLTYERMIWHNQSISVGASYNFPSLFLLVMPAITNPKHATLKQYSLRGARLTLGYRYYPLRSTEAPEGFFFGPYLSYNFVKLQARHGNGSYQVLNYTNASVILGYQAMFRKHIFFEIFGGLGYKRNFEVDYDPRVQHPMTSEIYNSKFPFFKNVKLALQMNLGYGW